MHQEHKNKITFQKRRTRKKIFIQAPRTFWHKHFHLKTKTLGKFFWGWKWQSHRPGHPNLVDLHKLFFLLSEIPIGWGAGLLPTSSYDAIADSRNTPYIVAAIENKLRNERFEYERSNRAKRINENQNWRAHLVTSAYAHGNLSQLGGSGGAVHDLRCWNHMESKCLETLAVFGRKRGVAGHSMAFESQSKDVSQAKQGLSGRTSCPKASKFCNG